MKKKILIKIVMLAFGLSLSVYGTAKGKESQGKIDENKIKSIEPNLPAKKKSIFTFLPDNKKRVSEYSLLKIRDPFIKQIIIKEQEVEEEVKPIVDTDDNEEEDKSYAALDERNKIIDAMSKLKVQGVSMGANPKVLLGTVVCEIGKTIPHIIPKQTQIPYVDDIDISGKYIYFKFMRVPEDILPSQYQNKYFKISFKRPEISVQVDLVKDSGGGEKEISGGSQKLPSQRFNPENEYYKNKINNPTSDIPDNDNPYLNRSRNY